MKKLIFSVTAVVLLLGLMLAPAQATPPPPGAIQTAISNGLAWLANQQGSDGSWNELDPIGATGLVLVKFLDYAYENGKNPFQTDPTKADYYQYAGNVASGLTYLFNNAIYDSTNNWVYFASVPETTLNHVVYYFSTYETSTAMMALAATRSPAVVISNGACSGMTYKAALQDMMNWLVSGQIATGKSTGGWTYDPAYLSLPNAIADQSNTGYATLALGFANAPEYGFDVTMPPAVLINLGPWISAVQFTSGADAGGSAYNPFGSMGANIYRTGTLLYELALVGKTPASAQVQAAVTFIENTWSNNAYIYDLGGWIGDYQAMWALMKGMNSLGIQQITVGGNQINWFDDVANYILNTENVVDATHCYWDVSSALDVEPSAGYPILHTAWALLTLEKTVPHVVQPPTANAGGPYIVDEGSCVTLVGSGTDPQGLPLTYAWDLNGDGVFETPGSHVSFCGIDGPATRTVGLQVCNASGKCATDNATVTINNVPPTVGVIAAPSCAPLNTAINASASFTDPGMLDTHTAVWNWGDGSSSPGVVTEVHGSGSAAGSHTYTAAGIYTVTLTVTDKDGGQDHSTFQYIVYDPNGVVTGNGWIKSPAGAYKANPQLTGMAGFGFVANYNRGATVPSGATEFHFPVCNLNFYATSYQWLVVTGAKAQCKGTGTINGTGNYGFMLTVIDGQAKGGGGLDKFRIKIMLGSNVIYDNQMGAPDSANPTTTVAGFNIFVYP